MPYQTGAVRLDDERMELFSRALQEMGSVRTEITMSCCKQLVVERSMLLVWKLEQLVRDRKIP